MRSSEARAPLQCVGHRRNTLSRLVDSRVSDGGRSISKKDVVAVGATPLVAQPKFPTQPELVPTRPTPQHVRG